MSSFKKITLLWISIFVFASASYGASKDQKKPISKKPIVAKEKKKEKPKPAPEKKPVPSEESSGPIVRKIEFSGVKNTPQDQLKIISNKYFGKGMYGDWTETMLAEIRAIPMVREANLMRDMTGNITIQIKERDPIAYLYLDKYYLMDEQGNVVSAIDNQHLDDKVFFSGPWKNPADYIKKNGPSVILQGIFFYTQLLVNEFEEKKISEIHFDDNVGWSMYRIGSRAPIVFGTQNLPEKIERFVQVVPQLSPIENSIARVDADFNDRVVVKLLTAPGKVVK